MIWLFLVPIEVFIHGYKGKREKAYHVGTEVEYHSSTVVLRFFFWMNGRWRMKNHHRIIEKSNGIMQSWCSYSIAKWRVPTNVVEYTTSRQLVTMRRSLRFKWCVLESAPAVRRLWWKRPREERNIMIVPSWDWFGGCTVRQDSVYYAKRKLIRLRNVLCILLIRWNQNSIMDTTDEYWCQSLMHSVVLSSNSSTYVMLWHSRISYGRYFSWSCDAPFSNQEVTYALYSL